MIVALHIDVNDWSRLLGLWAAPPGTGGTPAYFYPDPEDGLATGQGWMDGKGDAVAWSALFWRLQSASPYSAYWSVREVDDDVPLPDLFEELAIEVVESADNLASTQLSDGWKMSVPGVTEISPTPAELSVAVGGPSYKFEPREKLSSFCEFFADDDRMVVVARGDVDRGSADLAVAWGLAFRGDRSLSLVLPAHRAAPTMVRVPWLLPPVRVFTYDKDVVAEPPPLTKDQSVAAFRDRIWDTADWAVLGDKADWVRSVLDWTSIAPEVDEVIRSSYVAWHVAGRQVLRMTPTKKRLNVVAGVDSTKPKEWPTPVKVALTDQADATTQHALIAAASLAASARLAGDDAGHREHRMQAALQPDQLGLADGWKREFPAWRPGSNRAAFIDFLAKDKKGRAHVVETKIGADAMLVLQGLDYWLWCRANTKHVNAVLETSSKQLPAITFVVAPTKPGGEPISIYTAAQAEALHREIKWRFVVVDQPDTGEDVTALAPYRLPAKHRRAGDTASRWAVRLRQHGISRAIESGASLVRTHSFANAHDGLVPGAHDVYDELVADGSAHSHIAHVSSSQAFALNLLAPLTAQDWTEIAQHHLQDPAARVVEPVAFEYADPDDVLAEATKASPHKTQVDCLVWIELERGRRHALLIEVKLSEENFSKCSAYTSPKNTRRSICGQPGPFGGDTAGCFQLANHDREHRRRYDEALGTPGNEPNTFGCWFQDGANQVMRNAALAKSLIARGEVHSASMMLMAPDAHTSVWEQWHRHIALMSQYDDITFADLQASKIAALHPPAQARELSDRYLLPTEMVDIRRTQQLVDNRFPNGAVLIRLNDDGSIRYTQLLDRMPVTKSTTDSVTFMTPYPAGPFFHKTPRSSWEDGTGDIVIPTAMHETDPHAAPIPDGDGSRIISNDLTQYEYSSEELPNFARLSRLQSPWWTALGPDFHIWLDDPWAGGG